MLVCVFVRVFVHYRNPNCWTDLDEIWHRGGPQGVKVLGFFLTWYPHSPGYRVGKGGSVVPLEPQPCVGSQSQIWKDMGPHVLL